MEKLPFQFSTDKDPHTKKLEKFLSSKQQFENEDIEIAMEVLYGDLAQFQTVSPENRKQLQKKAKSVFEFINSAELSPDGALLYAKYLDMKSEEGFKRTRNLLHGLKDYIFDAYLYSGGKDSAGYIKVQEVINKKLDDPHNNYFYNGYCHAIIGPDNIDIIREEITQGLRPFEVQPGLYALEYLQKLYLIDQEAFNAFKKKYPKDEFMFIKENSVGTIDPKSFFMGSTELTKEQSETLQGEYEDLMNSAPRSFFENDLGINLSHLSIQEQFNLLQFMKSQSVESTLRVKDFVKKFGETGFRTFLSIEHGGMEMGNEILTLGEKLPKENSGLLFSKYAEIIDEVQNVADYLFSSLKEKTTPKVIEQTKEQLLIKGKDMLVSYAHRAERCAAQECTDLGRELETRLKDLRTSIVLLASTVKTLVTRGEFNMKDLKDIEVSYNQQELSKQDKETMRMMVQENTKQYPEKLRDYWRGTAESALEHPALGETFISVKYHGEIICVMRVIQREDGSFYGGSFNVNPSIKGSRIGTELLREVIDKYTKQGDFIADVYEKNPMLNTYIEKFGFEVIRSVENYHDTGATILSIIKRKQNQK